MLVSSTPRTIPCAERVGHDRKRRQVLSGSQQTRAPKCPRPRGGASVYCARSLVPDPGEATVGFRQVVSPQGGVWTRQPKSRRKEKARPACPLTPLASCVQCRSWPRVYSPPIEAVRCLNTTRPTSLWPIGVLQHLDQTHSPKMGTLLVPRPIRMSNRAAHYACGWYDQPSPAGMCLQWAESCGSDLGPLSRVIRPGGK